MRLADERSPSTIELEVLAYQFPDLRPAKKEFDWDANWLRISGRIATPERSWSFTDPCLATNEAGALGAWLREVAEGEVQPSEDVFGRGLSGAHMFIEPNLGVQLAAKEDSLLTLVWYFSQGASPPGSSDDVRYGLGHPVEIVVSAPNLARAARDWATELSRFPVRSAN